MSIEQTGAVEPRIGDTLRLAREARDMTLGDVSKALLVRENYLQAIEDMYANGVPKGYLSGILRSYAGFLDLPAEEAVKTFSEQCGAVSQSEKIEVASAVPCACCSSLTYLANSRHGGCCPRACLRWRTGHDAHFRE